MSKADFQGQIPEGSPEAAMLASLDESRLPRHVAIIMDGNGRWARQRRLPRVEGHRAGINAVRETVEAAAQLGIEVLTLYAFSRENWKRPKDEIETLMDLLKEFVAAELGTLLKHSIRFNVIGRMHELDPDVQKCLQEAISLTAKGDGLLFNIALSYGGRTEITEAAAAAHRFLCRPENQHRELDETLLSSFLYTRGQPDPDLLIRTSGEMRVSNFLLWQIAYAEIWVTEVLWPDFRRGHLFEALVAFQKRKRRYGGLQNEGGPSRQANVLAPSR
ncbi:MAG: isoprenyl transferase [Acidobacteria bacterium]|nr:isoprenyl transferase [Acidobacteriota bacterium]MCZ6832639.1 isoprenyl transferase [Acidobacteriota bacterium]